MPPTLRSLLIIPGICTTILTSLLAHAYIPAVAVNDTTGLNLTDSSTISISWQDPAGVFSGPVSYQLRADVATGGTTAGALVHFTESDMGQNLTTSTPWIAYISCDANETNASMEWDIFTLARDRGAVSALLYSATSQACLLNIEYITDFEKPLDVFATKNISTATLLDSQFQHTNATFLNYNGTLLNDSGTIVNNSLAGNPPSSKTFLIGTLVARDTSGQATMTSIPNAATSTASSKSDKNTSPAMIVLYVITGCIVTMFLTMLVMGARRARRHPEMYGRREGDDSQGAQTTAGGIAQAILDTFPVIKFNRRSEARQMSQAKAVPSENDLNRGYDLNVIPSLRDPRIRQSGDMERGRSSATTETGSFHSARSAVGLDDDDGYGKPVAGSSASHSLLGDAPRSAGPPVDDDIGQDQCPICLIDFEEGDDLRVLPCEREHVYHQTCIDPWLLNVSSSCPLCRKDFNAPAAPPINPVPRPLSDPGGPGSASPTHVPPTQGGFAKYLHLMRRQGGERNRDRRSRRRADTRSSAMSAGAESSFGLVGPGRSREADQTGPGGY